MTAGITAAGGASAKMAMDFEDAMAKVNTIADTTEVPLSELEKAILDLSNQTGISSSEIAGNVYDAISAGQKTGDAVNFVSNSTKLERAGFAVAGSAQDVATAESTTYMNSMFNELGKSGTKVSDTLKEKTGKSFLELMQDGASLSGVLQVISDSAAEQGLAFSDLWGSAEAGKAGLILLGDSAETFNGTLEQMQNSTGATETAFGKLNTNSYTIQKAFNQLKNTAIELGSAIMSVLAPVLVALADKIQAFTSWFSGLSEGTKKMIVIIAMVVAAVGSVLIIVGKIATGISAVMSLVGVIAPVIFALIPVIASVGAPILAIIAVIAAVIAVGKLLVAHWDEIKAACMNIWNAVKEFLAGLWEGIKQTASAAWTAISQFYSTPWTGIATVAQTIWNGIAAFFSALWEGIKTLFQTVISTVLNTIHGIVATVWNGIRDVVSTVMNTVGSVISNVWNAVKNGFEQTVGYIKELASSAWDWDVDIVNGFGMANAGTICIPVYMGGTLLDEIAGNAQERQNLRSGGR